MNQTIQTPLIDKIRRMLISRILEQKVKKDKSNMKDYKIKNIRVGCSILTLAILVCFNSLSQDSTVIDGIVISIDSTDNLESFTLRTKGDVYSKNPFQNDLQLTKIRYKLIDEGKTIQDVEFSGQKNSFINILKKECSEIDSLFSKYELRNNLCLCSEVEVIEFFTTSVTEPILRIVFYCGTCIHSPCGDEVSKSDACRFFYILDMCQKEIGN